MNDALDMPLAGTLIGDGGVPIREGVNLEPKTDLTVLPIEQLEFIDDRVIWNVPNHHGRTVERWLLPDVNPDDFRNRRTSPCPASA